MNLLGLPHPWIRVEGVHGAGAIVTVVGFEGHEPEHGGISAWELRWSEPDSYRRSPMPIDFGVYAGVEIDWAAAHWLADVLQIVVVGSEDPLQIKHLRPCRVIPIGCWMRRSGKSAFTWSTTSGQRMRRHSTRVTQSRSSCRSSMAVRPEGGPGRLRPCGSRLQQRIDAAECR